MINERIGRYCHLVTGTVVVTGCSSGIGRATALALHDCGLNVVATMRDSGKTRLPCRVEYLDVRRDDSVDELFDRLGPIDVLVNNAGIGGPGSCEDTDVGYLRQVMETNFYGAVRCTRKVVPSMRQRRAGCIVNVSSTAGRVVTPMQSAYTASKFALEAWSETLACEVARFGIRVAIVEPGVVITPMLKKSYREPGDVYVDQWSRLVRMLRASARHRTMPKHVAAVIVEAVTTDEPRVRWLIGPDAEQLIQRNRETTDERRLRLYAEVDDDAFWTSFEHVYGSEVAPPRS
jgi:NAD(P)-dependent dehydrogenase (short-subunit alcohol dehydrogenase family)